LTQSADEADGADARTPFNFRERGLYEPQGSVGMPDAHSISLKAQQEGLVGARKPIHSLRRFRKNTSCILASGSAGSAKFGLIARWN
jgi:hypothetical protein